MAANALKNTHPDRYAQNKMSLAIHPYFSSNVVLEKETMAQAGVDPAMIEAIEARVDRLNQDTVDLLGSVGMKIKENAMSSNRIYVAIAKTPQFEKKEASVNELYEKFHQLLENIKTFPIRALRTSIGCKHPALTYLETLYRNYTGQVFQEG